ncbi:putative nepenthesin [Lupinus albus]|uniref:Putative nepenthesin n=1 Tax=Lupinus albus TaxID=3870 RepID=A0A6A4N9I2_LUPAL|nr:putative nepenthesin [Lupinus albus]
MQIFIGTPPKKIIAVADTGSDLTWVQCRPCNNCYFQNFPLFDPSKSYTHRVIPCTRPTCSYLYIHSCGITGECIYGVQYEDESNSKGYLSTDTISFNNTYIGRIIKYSSITLGCGYNNYGSFTPTAEGIVGLGGGPLSLITQIGYQFGKRKFSYCFLPYNSRRTGQIKFGFDTQKQKSLERISVSGETFKPKANETVGNFVVDSGTTFTFLKHDLFYKLRDSIIESIGKRVAFERSPPKPFELCYKDGAVRYFPLISFYFAKADIGLHFPEDNVFGRVGPFMCLFILPTYQGHSTFGSYQQVLYNVEYDLDKRTISLAPSNCE